MRFTFKKTERLCNKIAIDSLFQQGKSFSIYPFRIIWQLVDSNQLELDTKVLISVPKKKIKKAVNRNLIKRRIKEAYRLNKSKHFQSIILRDRQLHFAIIYLSPEVLPYPKLNHKIILSLQRLVEVVKNETV